MQVEEGKFYFIKDEFFEIFKNYKLMINKESGNKRPCYFCFHDKDNPNIIWFVPISSKVSKYKEIFNKKIQKNKEVLNFVFGKILGKDRVFLIQNIFPTTNNFIINKYKQNNIDVEISKSLKDRVIKTSTEVIKLSKRGIKIPFYDINKMKDILENLYLS